MAKADHLRLIDTETGEVYANDCPNCALHERTYAELERKYKGLLSQLGKLRADHEAAARADNIWPNCVAIFRYWQERTGHHQSEFTVERFEMIAARMRKHGPDECRLAVDGCLLSPWHQKRGPAAKRKGPIHDSLQIIFEKQDNWEGFRKLAKEAAGIPTITAKSMVETAQDVANRVLERAELIRRGDDPVALAHLLVEINRILVEWEHVPENPAPPRSE